jgi:WD40 repeat protein
MGGAQPDRPDVFVSYAREDVEFVARRLVPALEARGKAVWVDLTGIPPAAEWRERIRSGIAAAKAVVAVLSPAFVASRICADEIEQAAEANKRLIPVVAVPVDHESLHPALAELNWIVLDDEDYEAGLSVLVDALDTDLSWRDAHARLTVRAREWSSTEQDRSRLLRGSDLKAAERWLSGQALHAEKATDDQTQFIIASRRASWRRLQVMLGAAVLAVVVATVLGVVALIQRNEAIRRQHIAQSRALAASAVNQLSVDPQLSVLLAARAERTADTSQARNALRDALQRSKIQTLIRAPRGQGGQDTSAVLCPGGTTVATSFGQDVSLWDGRTDKRIATLAGHRGFPSCTSDGRYLLTTYNDRHVWVYDARTGKPVRSLVGDVAVRDVRSSPDGRLVAGLAGTEVLVWDVATGRLAARLPQPAAPDSAAFDAGSDLLLTASSDGMRVWRWASAKLVSRFGAVHRDDHPAGQFAGAGDVVVTTGVETATGERGHVVFWHGETGREAAELPAGTFTERAVVSADGGRVVASGFGSPPTVTPLAAGLPAGKSVELADAARAPGDAEFSPDGHLVVVAGADGVARIFDATSGHLQQSFAGHTDSLLRASFSTDGDWVLTTSVDGTARVWRTGLRTFWSSATDMALDARFSPDARVVAATTGDGLAHVWDAATGREKLHFPLSKSKNPETNGALAFTADGSVLTTESSGDERRRVDLRRNTWLGRNAGNSYMEVLSPDGRLIAAPDESGREATVREIASGGRVGSVPLSEAAGPTRFADHNKRLIVQTLENLEIWDFQRRRRLGTLPIPATPAALDFATDGQVAATGKTSGEVVIWDLSRGLARRVRTLPAADRYAISVDLSGDDRLAAVGFDSGKVQVWGIPDGEPVASFSTPSQVTHVEFAPDWSSLLVGSGASRAGASGTVSVYACDSCRDTNRMLRLADTRSTRQLTPAEIARFGA